MNKDEANRIFWALAVWVGVMLTVLLTAVVVDLSVFILERTQH